MQKALLALFFLISTSLCFGENSLLGYSLIAKGKTKEGIKLLESTFPTMQKEEKISAAFVLAQAEPSQLENSPGYFAKYSLKYNSTLDSLSQAKLQRILADELFGTGAIKDAVAAYESALELGKEDLQLSLYIRYKLGWAYVNQNHYEKLFVLWSPYLSTEHILSQNYIHDYGKFWMEHSLRTHKIIPLPDFPFKDLPQFTKGLIDGFMRDFQKKSSLEKILKTAPTPKERSLFIVGLLPFKGLPACEKILLMDRIETEQQMYFEGAVVKPILDECLEQSLAKKDSKLLSILEHLYTTFSTGLRERAIVRLNQKDTAQACSLFSTIFTASTDKLALELATDQQETAGCFLKPEYLKILVNKLIENFKVWPEEVLLKLMLQKSVAKALYSEIPKNWNLQTATIKFALLKGLEGEVGYLDYYKNYYQDERSLLGHCYNSTGTESIEKALVVAQGLSTAVQAELKLLSTIRSGKYEGVEKLVSGCKAFSDRGIQLLLNHIIEQKEKTLFFDNFTCFTKENLSEEQKVAATILGPAPRRIDEPFLNYVNEVLYKTDFKEISEFDKQLQKNYRSILTFKEAKVSLRKFKGFGKNQIPAWDNKVLLLRKSILKTEWMNDDLKLLMTSFFNNALDEANTHLSKLPLGENEKKLLLDRYEGLKFK